MASPILNLTIFTKSTPHALRALTLAVFPPAFLYLLVFGISSSKVNPAIGILPLFFSAAYAFLLLTNEKKCGCQASGLTGTPIHFILDFAIGVGLLTCLILAWVNLHNHWSPAAGMIIMGTYGTNFLICSFLIHLYFVVKQIQESMTAGPNYPMSCPQCQNRSFYVGNFQVVGRMRDGYAPLLDSDGAPRISVDEVRVNDGEQGV